MNTNITTKQKHTGSAARKRSPRNCLTQFIALRITSQELESVEQLAIEESRSRASFLRILILLGLEVFKQQRTSQQSMSSADELRQLQDKQPSLHLHSNFIAGR